MGLAGKNIPYLFPVHYKSEDIKKGKFSKGLEALMIEKFFEAYPEPVGDAIHRLGLFAAKPELVDTISAYIGKVGL